MYLEAENSLSAVQNQGRADQANWTPRRCLHGPRTFSSSWISPKPSRPMSQTDSWPPLLPLHVGSQAPEVNRQHSSRAFFADESLVSLYNYNGHARLFRRVVERLVDGFIHETDGIHKHEDQNGRGWPWDHHRISHETSADASRFGVCLPTCGGRSNDEESVWGIGLDMSDIQPLQNVLGPCGQWQGVLICPTLIWTLRENSFTSE